MFTFFCKIRHIKIAAAVVISFCATFSSFGQSILYSSSTRSAIVGLVVKDLSTDSLLIVHNYDKSITPASVMKSVTAASAMLELPADFRFLTVVNITGKLSKSVLKGNIVINGSGDPTLESCHFPDNLGFVDSIVSLVKKHDIKRIAGKILFDRTEYDYGCVSQYWLLEDLPWDYGTGHFPVNYRDNTFRLTISGKSGYSSKPTLDYIRVFNQVKKGKRNGAILTRGEGSSDFYLKGTAVNPSATRVYDCANPAPSKLLVSELRTKLKEAGIELEGGLINNFDVVDTYFHKSPVLDDIMHSMMVRSDNMFAEGMLRVQPLADDSDETVEESSAAELARWKSLGVFTEGVSIMDGSGLARSDKLTPHFESDVLTYMARSEYAERYLALFPRAGMEGTLKNLLKGTRLQGKLALKSGSMRGVQCYAGYKIDENNRPTHVVVILVNNFNGSRQNLKSAISNFLLETFQEDDSYNADNQNVEG